MGLIKEPKGVDFVVEGRDLTLEEQQKVSDYIRHQQKQQNDAKRILKNRKKYAS